jgi:DNA-directed RNA polymerase subunit RPC12/RpoP
MTSLRLPSFCSLNGKVVCEYYIISRIFVYSVDWPTNEINESQLNAYHKTQFMIKYHPYINSWSGVLQLWDFVTNFFLIKSTDALNSQIYFCQETRHVSGSSSAHHQEFSTVHSALVYVMQVWWQLSSRTRIVLDSYHQTCTTYVYQCRMCSGKLLMMGRGTARNMSSFLTKINLGN